MWYYVEMGYSIICVHPPEKHEGVTHKVQDYAFETIFLWIDIGLILLRACPHT